MKGIQKVKTICV